LSKSLSKLDFFIQFSSEFPSEFAPFIKANFNNMVSY